MTEMTEADRKAFEEWVVFEIGMWKCDPTTIENLSKRAWQAALTHARGKQEPVAWLPMDSAPKDSTLVRLIVQPDIDAFTSFEDSKDPYETIGFNQLEHTLIDAWEFAGWCWQHDVFITGSGTPIGWLPLSAPPSESDELARLRAIEVAALAWWEGRTPKDGKEIALCVALAEAESDALAASPAPVVDTKTPETVSNDVCASTASSKPRVTVPDGQTPLDDILHHPLLDVFQEGVRARDKGIGSPYHGHSLEHCIHAAGWVQQDLRIALDKAKSVPVASKPKVKALVWESGSYQKAITPIGTYGAGKNHFTRNGEWVADTANRDEAKAYAQADFERRILSAIEGGEDE